MTCGCQFGKFTGLTSIAIAEYGYGANGNIMQKSKGDNLWRYSWG